jgi:PPOX class probable F420-dependent enzyme
MPAIQVTHLTKTFTTKRKAAGHMERKMDIEKQKKIEALLAKPTLGRLATASPSGQPHVVPVWFLWEEGAAWISSYQTTRKVKDLRRNPRCALVVDLPKAEGGITAVLLEGKAELLAGNRPEVRARIERLYVKHLGAQGILAKEPQEWLNSSENLLIKLTPKKVISW